jgi:hypothetical protein
LFTDAIVAFIRITHDQKARFTVPLTVFPGKVEENDRGRVAHDARSPDVAKIRPFDA